MTTPAPTASTNTATLRDVTDADLPIFFEQQLDPDATQMAAFPARDHNAFMSHWAKILADDTLSKQTILCDGQVAGNIVSWDQAGQQAVGYWLGKEFWGKGIATRALAQFLLQVTARPLYAFVAKHNAASVRVLQKCGFAICGMEFLLSEEGAEMLEEYILKLDA